MTQFLKFLLAGGVAALVNILARLAFSTTAPYEIAVILAYLCGMATAFILSKLFVFVASGQSTVQEILRFTLVNAVALVQVWIVSVALAKLIFPEVGFTWHSDFIAHVIGVASPILTSFIGHKYFSFRSQPLSGPTHR